MMLETDLFGNMSFDDGIYSCHYAHYQQMAGKGFWQLCQRNLCQLGFVLHQMYHLSQVESALMPTSTNGIFYEMPISNRELFYLCNTGLAMATFSFLPILVLFVHLLEKSFLHCFINFDEVSHYQKLKYKKFTNKKISLIFNPIIHGLWEIR